MALVVAVATVVAVWLVDTKWIVQACVTALAVAALLALWSVSRTTRRQAQQLAIEAGQRSREQRHTRQQLAEVNTQLAELRAQHVELLLELRALREEGVQQAMQYELLLPRATEPEPVYPSLQLPLVRAAFATELPPPPADPSPTESSYPLEREVTSGAEPQPPRQLLDLTASEIARLRPAN